MVVKNRAVDIITGHLKGTDSLPFCLRVIICRLPADASLPCHKCWSVSQQVSLALTCNLFAANRRKSGCSVLPPHGGRVERAFIRAQTFP